MVDMNDTMLAPHSDHFGDVSAADWAAFADGYADLFDDLLDMDSDPAPVLRGSASSRAPRRREVPSRRPRVERPRQLVQAL